MHSLSNSSQYSTTTRWVFTAILIVIILVAAWYVRGILLLALGSVILVVLFTMPIRYLIRRGLSRVVATLLSLSFIVLTVVTLFVIALPTLVQQFATLTTETIPEGVQTLIARMEAGEFQGIIPEGIDLSQLGLQELVNTLGVQLASAVGQLGLSVIPVLGGVADTLLSILIIIFLSLYLLADPQSHQEGIIKLFPIWYRYRVREIFARLDFMMRGWLRATLFSMLFVGVATWILLSLLDIEQAAALGVLAGLLSFIPNFGPIITLIPSLAVGAVQSPTNLGWIVVITYGVSFVQSQIVTPLLVAGSLKIPPVLVLLGQIIAGAFLGFMGIVLAVPITAILMVLVQEVYIKDMLGDTTPDEPSVLEEALVPDGV